MKVSATSLGLKFTLTNGFAVSMLDHEHPDGTREFAVLDKEGELLPLGGDTIAYATKAQIVAMVTALETRSDWGLKEAARALFYFFEAMKEED